ncbi:MAG: phosphatase PAP2 family protein [Motiliproteus sp.]
MNDSEFPYSRRWQLKPFVLFHLIAILLLASWVIPAGHQLWRTLDEAVFFALNGTLSEGTSWQFFWALMNERLADIIPAVIILTSLTFPVAGVRRYQLQKAFLGFFVLMIVMFIIRRTLHDITVNIGLSVDSPSLQLQPAFFLSELVPELSPKDRAQHSFPGDHAAVLWAWAGYMMFMLRSKLTALTVIICALFTLPRMLGGAHWFSDNYVGGIAVALLTLSWAFHTPALVWPTATLHRLLAPVFSFIGEKVPLLGQLPFFSHRDEKG